MTFWTDERCDELRQQCASVERPSASEIGLRFGVSRNAVIGKINRLGLVLPNHGSHQSHKPRPIKPRPERKTKLKLQARTPSKPRVDDAPLISFEGPGLSLIELTNSTCRWPVGEPGTPSFFFCGAPGASLEEHRPYCGGGHCRRFKTTIGEGWQ